MKIHPVLENGNPSESYHDPLDAIAAAPKNHKVLYEDDHVRVLEVTVQPGEIENMHHHPCASVFAHDAPMPKFTNSFADDGSVMELGRNLRLISGDPKVPADVVAALAQLNAQFDAAMSNGLPMAWSSPPQGTHSVHNLDTFPMHFYRIEFKRVEGNDIINTSFTQVDSDKIRSEQAYHDRQTIDEQLNPYQMQADVAENRLIGTWKLRSLVYEAAASGQRSRPFGDHPGGYLSYSPDGRMYAIGVAEDRPKPLDLVATDEEKARLQGSIFAYAGTYMADSEKVIHHIDISWNQSWTGTDLVRFYKLDSSTLTITTAPARSAFDGEEGVFILVWEKVK